LAISFYIYKPYVFQPAAMRFTYYHKFIFTIFGLACYFCSSAQKINIESEPGWIKKFTFDNDAKTPPSGGFYYLLIDNQVNVTTSERYFHEAYKILNSEGMQDMADLSVDYDPSYQHLVFHKILVHRGKEKVSHLIPSQFKIIQREEEADRYLYDGSLTAVLNLRDVRIGDVIEYSYTKKGFNPIFEGNFSTQLHFDWGTPYEKYEYRILTPTTEKFYTQVKNGLPEPEIEKVGNITSYGWSMTNHSPLIKDDHVPEWYDPYRCVSLTNVESWDQIAKWSRKRYNVEGSDLKTLKQQIEGKFSQTTKKQYAEEVIRFVQDEVRYLGFESGSNGYKPHSPLKVFAQRFGDCKDKSLLLCTLLKINGIESSPMLVNTTIRNKLGEILPSATAFDHCVVELRLGGKEFYIDPTINNQGGTLENISFPAYGKGLVINKDRDPLIDLPTGGNGSIQERETLEVSAVGEPALMSVETSYLGDEADYQRSRFSSSSIESVQKQFLSFYSDLYPTIQKIENLTFEDKRNENVFIIREKYKVTDFWKRSPEGGEEFYCELYPLSLEHYFNISKFTQRTAPYSLTYPLTYDHRIIAKMPAGWSVIHDSKVIDNPSYKYQYRVYADGQEAYMETQYATKSDFIHADEMQKFADDHKIMMRNLSYFLNPKGEEKGFDKNLLTVIGVVASALIFFWLALRLFQRRI
jgi:transglutaminase-like putative cysteine protease